VPESEEVLKTRTKPPHQCRYAKAMQERSERAPDGQSWNNLSIKINNGGRYHKPVILATWEAEIRRIEV
jgi:hypothetical protein